MNRFLETIPLRLTPLTPIHVGCGQDFDPTNYIIDNELLYEFNPAHLRLDEHDRDKVIESASRRGHEAILELQRLFHGRRAQCVETSRLRIPVAPGVARRYKERVGQVAQRETDGRAVINELAIERTAHHVHSSVPYLPGSGLKGAMRTGWLNQLDQGAPVPHDRDGPARDKASEVEADLLGGTFSADPFRLVDVADASGEKVQSSICFAVNRRKGEPSPRSRSPREKNLSVCCEVISGGQFRVLNGEIRLEQLPASAGAGYVTDFTALAGACNRFYLERLKLELQLLKTLAGGPWAEAFADMIRSIEPSLAAERAVLLRVGRHSGAESVTLKRRRWIQIMEGRGRRHWADAATTVWLAAPHEDSSSGMRPFGWLLVEQSGERPEDALQRWCDSERDRASRQPQPSVMASQFVFRRGDRVTDGDQTGRVFRDVRSTDTRMEVDFGGGEIESVPVLNWRKA
jgi:CRISPR-associated protein Csm5